MVKRSIREILGVNEVVSIRFLKSSIAEFIGTAILVLIGCGSVATLNPGSAPPIITVAFAFGFALALVIWVFGHISGAHVNPAVSVAFLVTGHISVLKCVFYVLAQLAGGIIGAAMVWHCIPDAWRGSIGSSTLADGVAEWQGVLIELVGTFLLVITIFASCDRLRTDHSGSIALSIGFCLTAQITWSGTLTGCSLNPARSLGPAVWSGIWDDHWIYWTAPVAGGIIAAFLYQHVFAEGTRETDADLHKDKYNYEDGYDVKRAKTGFLDYTIDIEAPQDQDGFEAEKPGYKSYHMDTISNSNSNSSALPSTRREPRRDGRNEVRI